MSTRCCCPAVLFLLCAAVDLLSAGPDAAWAQSVPRGVHLSVGADPTSSMVIVFSLFGSVENRTAAGLACQLGRTGTPTFVPELTLAPDSAPASLRNGYARWLNNSLYRVTARGLEPDTVYFYRCGVVPPGGGSFVGTGLLSLRTAPDNSQSSTGPNANRQIYGAVLGQQGTTVVASTVAQVFRDVLDGVYAFANRPRLDFGLHAGDIALPSGEDDWDTWFDFMEPLGSQFPLMTAPCRRDTRDYGAPAGVFSPRFTDGYFARYPNPNTAVGGSSKLFYCFNYSWVHTIVMDTEQDWTPGSAQRSWLESALAAANTHRIERPWLFVVCHRPPFATSGERSNLLVRRDLARLFHVHGVDVVFSAGRNFYEQTFPSTGAAVVGGATGQGTAADPFVNAQTVYVVAGTSGEEIQGADTDPAASWSRFRSYRWGAAEFFARTTSLDLTFTTQFGEDRFYYTRDLALDCPSRVLAAPCSGHGNCTEVLKRCVCEEGFHTDDCSQYSQRTVVLAARGGAPWNFSTSSSVDAVPAGWTTDSFSDATWSTGAAPLGFGAKGAFYDGFSASLPPLAGSQAVYLFRSHFILPASAPLPAVATSNASSLEWLSWESSVAVSVAAEGGCWLYVNGQLLEQVNASAPHRFWNQEVRLPFASPTLRRGARNQLALLVRAGGSPSTAAMLMAEVAVEVEGRSRQRPPPPPGPAPPGPVPVVYALPPEPLERDVFSVGVLVMVVIFAVAVSACCVAVVVIARKGKSPRSVALLEAAAGDDQSSSSSSSGESTASGRSHVSLSASSLEFLSSGSSSSSALDNDSAFSSSPSSSSSVLSEESAEDESSSVLSESSEFSAY